MNNIIEQISGKFRILYSDWLPTDVGTMKKVDDKNKKILFEQALKENTEAVIKEMLVEEREHKPNCDDLENPEFCTCNVGLFNQCCALQKEKANKIIEKIC